MSRIVVLVWPACLLVAACGGGGDDTAAIDASHAIIDAGVADGAPIEGGPLDPSVLHEVDIEILPADLDGFDVDQQTRVPCDVLWDGVLVANAGCRKKGSSGSNDAVTGKPSFSIKFDDTVPGQKVGTFDKLSLDNALQDPSLLDEHVSYEVFRRLGVAAHRTAYALVRLNGEARGVYVAVEPVDKEFLRARFGAANDQGHLYEAGGLCDFAVDPDCMELKDPAGQVRDDLNAAAMAVMMSSDAAFAAEVGARIDLEWFTRYFAGEMALAAPDGHAFGRNNYYLYHRPDTDRFAFLPHGQDLVLLNPGLSVDENPAALLAIRVRAIPALSSAVDDLLAEAAAPGGALDDATLGAYIDDAIALVTSTTRDDDFTAGDVATMSVQGPIFRDQLAWRASFIRGDNPPADCGDGVVHAGEQCDDGGTTPGDGCDAACFPECVTITDASSTPWRLCPAERDRATAIASCTAGGGSLVVPADATEAVAIAAIVRRHLGSADVWLGITDAATEDTWLTDAGDPVPYLGFTGTEPNGGASESCAVLDTGTRGGWRDQACDIGYAALCRLP